MSLQRDEIAAIAAYKQYARRHLPNTETLSGLWAPDFNMKTYRNAASALDALHLYLQELQPYMLALQKAAKLRQHHYERFIKRAPDREEDPGHRHWREALNAVALDAWEKHQYWSIRWSQEFDEIISSYTPQVSNLVAEVAKTRNVDFEENRRAAKKEKQELKIVKRPRLSNRERKRRQRVQDVVLAKAFKRQQAEDAQLFVELGYGNGKHKKCNAPYRFKYVHRLILFARETFTCDETDRYKLDNIAQILVIRPREFREEAKQMVLIHAILQPLATITDVKTLDRKAGIVIDALQGFYFANMASFAKKRHLFLRALFEFTQLYRRFQDVDYIVSLVVPIGGLFESVKSLTEGFKRFRDTVPPQLYENALALSQQNWFIVRLSFLNTVLRMYSELILNLDPSQSAHIAAMYPQVAALTAEDPFKVKTKHTKYAVQRHGTNVMRIAKELKEIKAEIGLVNRRIKK